MASEDRRDRNQQAAEIARLFLQLADQRPAVLDALQSLLSALCTSGPGSPEDGALPQDPRPAPPAGATTDEPPECAISLTPAHPAPARATSATETEGTPADPPRTPVSPSSAREVFDETKAEASMHMLRSLFPDGFGSGVPRGGLAAPTNLNARDTAPALWDEDAQAARELASLARTQAGRLRSIRRAKHEGRAVPQGSDLLSRHFVDDWLADPALAHALDPRDLREAERWYRTAGSALLEVADWLDSHPSTPLGDGYTPQALHDRLQCVATAQKGVCTWFDDHAARSLPAGRRNCGVQLRIYQQLAHVWTKNFRTKLDHMRRDERVANDVRAVIDRALLAFELESAPGDSKGLAGGASAAKTERASEDRFDSIAEALEVAEADFGGGKLVFTERARESAERSAFRRPGEVHAFFEALHAVAKALASGVHGDPHAMLLEHGFQSKPSHHLTMARHHRFYHMRFEGREIDLSQHVTLGSKNQNTCLSIHWWHHSPSGRFVIGHCGKHLPNTRT